MNTRQRDLCSGWPRSQKTIAYSIMPFHKPVAFLVAGLRLEVSPSINCIESTASQSRHLNNIWSWVMWIPLWSHYSYPQMHPLLLISCNLRAELLNRAHESVNCLEILCFPEYLHMQLLFINLNHSTCIQNHNQDHRRCYAESCPDIFIYRVSYSKILYSMQGQDLAWD